MRPVPAPAPAPDPGTAPYAVKRLVDSPIISAASDPSLDGNVNGPSLIRVPDWLPEPLGQYYLYFAHHKGGFIRLAYADDLRGPWILHAPGTLQLAESGCYDHIASPDVHVDHEEQRIRMYFHGPCVSREQAVSDRVEQNCDFLTKQRTKVALSRDGVSFDSLPANLGPSYFRVFRHEDWWYALAMPGVFFRSRDGLTGWEMGPVRFTREMRHSAVRVAADRLEVFYTRAGDCPERILLSIVDLRDDWQDWHESEPVEVIRPERPWEGVELPMEPSRRGGIYEPVRQLRDPGIYEENERAYLLYAVAGERGLSIAELLAP